MASDWKCQWMTESVGTGNLTLNAPADFDEVSSLDKAFIMSGCNRRSTAGGSTGDEEGNDLGCTVRFTATDRIVCTRSGGSPANTQNIAFTIVEYVGPSGGDYEFTVLHRSVESPGTGVAEDTALDISATDINDCIPFYTVAPDVTTDGWTNGCVALWCATDLLTWFRGGATTTCSMAVEVVEFTGSALSVGHGDSANTTADTGTIQLVVNADGSTGANFDVSAWSDVFIWHTFKANEDETDDSIADTSAVYSPTAASTTQVDWTFDAGHAAAATENRHFVHVLKCAPMTVTRYTGTSSTAGESTINITTAGLSEGDGSFVLGSSSSSGTGTAYARGFRMYYLNSLSEAAHLCSRSGNTMAHNLQIVDVSGMTTPGYANDVIGVASASIGDVTTVATASIAEVIGV